MSDGRRAVKRSSEVGPRPPLRRATGTPLAGVCQGLARHLRVSVPMVRTVTILLTLAAGIGLVLYFWLWIFVPSERETVSTAAQRGLSGPVLRDQQTPGAENTAPDGEGTRARRVLDKLTSSPEILLGCLLLAASVLLMLQVLGVNMNWRLIIPAAVLLAGILLAWTQLDSTEAERHRSSTMWQVGGGALLVMVALVVIAAGMTAPGDLVIGLMVAGILMCGLALVIAPWLIKLYRTSSVERARAAAEAERADIAAHLHDSVLQTLAMIQKQKADPAAVEQLARSQERQLRTWLYRQHAAETGSLKDQLLAVAAELEESHAVPVEVVTVGESDRTDRTPLVAAAREAILNAIRHAGPASVYVESNAEEDAVFVRDRGPGFDPATIAEDRLGVRESIVGRMERAGGHAKIRSSSTGTEIQLFLPADTARATAENERERP